MSKNLAYVLIVWGALIVLRLAVNGSPGGSGGYAAGGWAATAAGLAMVAFGLRRVLRGSGR